MLRDAKTGNLMRTRIIFLAVLIVILLADRAYACSCVPRMPPCEAYKETPAIFIALVTDIDLPSKDTNKSPYAYLSIEQAFKGINETKIKMWQGSGSGDCSFVFEKGERYLIYAGYSDETKQFHTNICTRSRPLAYAAEDLDYLRGLPSSNQGTRLSGTVVKYDYEEIGSPSIPELISGVKVIAEGENGQRFEAITNNEGFYKMVDLPSGRYKVRAEIPPYLSLTRDNQDIVEVPSKGCATADFLTRTDGRISGMLLDAQGRVMPETDVDLIPFELADKVGDRRIGRYKKTDEAGRFEFTELKPGRYLLGVNIRSEPDGDNPFRRTYFPGVSNVAEARVIVLSKGEKLKGYDLRLPPHLPVRIIRGVFVWQNGKPVTKALLTLKDTAELTGGQSLDFAEVDSQGRFSLKALEGTEAWVHGSVMIPVESGLDVMVAEPVRVVANSSLRPIKLIVSRKSGGGVKIIR